jgi:hypothetical protein
MSFIPVAAARTFLFHGAQLKDPENKDQLKTCFKNLLKRDPFRLMNNVDTLPSGHRSFARDCLLLEDINHDLVHEIMTFLDSRSLLSLGQTSSLMLHTSQSDILWKSLICNLEADFPILKWSWSTFIVPPAKEEAFPVFLLLLLLIIFLQL